MPFARLYLYIPVIIVLLIIGLVVYLAAQAKYSPNKAKLIVINVFIWITCILTSVLLLMCVYAILDKNKAVLELFATFAAVPALGLIIALLCKFVFYKRHPRFKEKGVKTDANESFKEFWSKRLKKAATDYIKRKFGGR